MTRTKYASPLCGLSNPFLSLSSSRAPFFLSPLSIWPIDPHQYPQYPRLLPRLLMTRHDRAFEINQPDVDAVARPDVSRLKVPVLYAYVMQEPVGLESASAGSDTRDPLASASRGSGPDKGARGQGRGI